MRLDFLVPVCPLILAGCLSPITDRLDRVSDQAASGNQQLILATAKLDEAKAILARAEDKMDQANRTFDRLEAHINNMDQKFATIEQGFRKMFNIKEEEDAQLFHPPLPFWTEPAKVEQP